MPSSGSMVWGRAFVQSAIAQKPAIIHVMVGTVDAYTYYDSTFNLVSQAFVSGLNNAIEQAKAAGIQVILGIEPSVLCSNSGELEVLLRRGQSRRKV